MTSVEGITEYTLANGLRVLLFPDASKQTTTLNVTYLVGSIEERHDQYSVLSTESPLGQALLGAGPGTQVKYQGPKRELGVTVVAVRPLS